MSQINQKLNELGIKIPEPAVPIANYVGFIVSGKNIFISGQLPIENGELKYIGKVGANISVEDARKAARICAINILSQLKSACGNLEKVTKCIKLGVFVNSVEDFIDHPAIANGASDLMVEIFAEKGKHARSAVGSSSLPRGVAVEVDAIFEIE
ncbi:MAG: RidA family protein [Rickettsiales bacterium]|jgi:enamine deaminase RidA (YjgF/YER057c/UK114 family)|nr:RidA family protein [Rickettsiales bacterium]